ncbi:hypothetical protein F2Q69_00029662 [Brassica cretica]|uniref:F-box protein At3g26010-like beta-propeller domain-containing protein n=1 Tax=Brassica cretica TaxID=69181 RepID=A0A8S9RZ30_BRACR|nr:hypothetical protein F2Q69_00029662 [Brassica cretica]
MFGTDYPYPIAEAIGFHGCSTWDLPRSPFQRYPDLPTRSYFYRSSSNGLIWIDLFPTRTVGMTFYYKTFLLRIEIPPPPQECKATALVTRVDEDGVVLSFKTIWECMNGECMCTLPDMEFQAASLLYSRSIHCLLPSCQCQCLWDALSVGEDSAPASLLAYDFFRPEDHDHCQVIPLPLPYHEDVRRCLTTSGGDVIYIEILYGRLKVWKLNNNKNDSGTMNPFNADFVYMWSVQDSCLVSGDLLLFIKSQRVGGTVKVVIA